MKVAVVTGGNAGIGLALCQRLLDQWHSTNDDNRLCLACRSEARAQAARSNLLSSHPQAHIDIILVDMCDVESVYRAVLKIKQKYDHVDYLFLNAGIMGKTSLDFNSFFRKLLSPDIINVMMTGHGILTQSDHTTKDGLAAIFSTNLFSHFVLVETLIKFKILGGTKSSQLIWNSSTNANAKNFSITDIQHTQGNEPYSSSKYATDQVSYSLNKLYNEKNVYSHLTTPGLVITNITTNILPSWLWKILTPLFYVMRLCVPTLTYSPSNGAEAMLWTVNNEPEFLDPSTKYNSHTNVWGQNYVEEEMGDINEEVGDALMRRLCDMEQRMRPEWFRFDS